MDALTGAGVMRRPLGKSGLQVSPIGLGCWPIAGMTSLDVNRRDSLATLHACADVGVNFLDTAFAYGADGESEKLIAEAVRGRRDQFVIATKGGVHWDADGRRVVDARPERLRHELHASLRRLQSEQVDLYYLHAPDPAVALSEVADVLREFQQSGLTRAVGASNLALDQMVELHSRCPLAACQPPYNMLQRQIESDLLPWCHEHDIAVVVYWPLMKGLLAGKMARDHRLPPADRRRAYPIYQGDEWERNQDFLDELRALAEEVGKTVAQVVLNWTIDRPGITAALCGAKRADQIVENAGALGWRLAPNHVRRIEEAIRRRGPAVTGQLPR